MKCRIYHIRALSCVRVDPGPSLSFPLYETIHGRPTTAQSVHLAGVVTSEHSESIRGWKVHMLRGCWGECHQHANWNCADGLYHYAHEGMDVGGIDVDT